jgi:peptidyl-prolyl cis-trans isomerase B (cyclophilin B)
MKVKTQIYFTCLLLTLFISGLTLGGCSSQQVTSYNHAQQQPAATTTPIAENNKTDMNKSAPRLEGKATVEMAVNGSPITIEIDGTDAPITAGNFVDLVERGFYNGLAFHRVVSDPQPFVVQGGDPKGNGTGGFTDPKTQKPRYIPLEIKLQPESKDKAGEIIYGKALGQQAGFSAPPVLLNHKRGAVAMARSQAPDSASSQFYFALSDLQFLDGDYAVFGYVTKGMDVVDKIQQGDRIQSAKVVSGLENLKR